MQYIFRSSVRPLTAYMHVSVSESASLFLNFFISGKRGHISTTLVTITDYQVHLTPKFSRSCC